MACFDNIIAIDGSCSDSVPTSGLFLNDIDISLDFLNEIVTRDYDNGEALGDAKIAFAIKKVVNDVVNHFADKINTTTIIDGQRIGFPEDDLKVVNGDGKLRGIEIELCNDNSFLDFYLSSLSVQVTTTGDIDVEVYDLKSGVLLDTITIPAVANTITTVFPNKTYSSDRSKLNLIFVYDTTGKNSIKTQLKEARECCSAGKRANLNAFTSARGAGIDSGDVKIEANIESSSTTAGLSMQYSISCNNENWLCNHKNRLGQAILYQAGKLITETALQSSPNERLNTTIINTDEMRERLDLYVFNYDQAIDNVLKHISLPNDRRCFQCKRKSMNTVILP